MLVRRKMLWVLVAQIVLVVLMADDLYLHRLSWFWGLVYPWGGTDRMVGVQYWLIPPVLGFGLIWLADVLRSLSGSARRWLAVSIAALVVFAGGVVAQHALGRLWTDVFRPNTVVIYPLGAFNRLAQVRPWTPTLAVAAIALAVAWFAFARHIDIPRFVRQRWGNAVRHLDAGGAVLGVLAVLSLVVGAASELGVYKTAVDTRSLVSPADVTVLQQMQRVLPTGSIVMSDSLDDAGWWMAALDHPDSLGPQRLLRRLRDAGHAARRRAQQRVHRPCRCRGGSASRAARRRLHRRAECCGPALPVECQLHRSATGSSTHRLSAVSR